MLKIKIFLVALLAGLVLAGIGDLPVASAATTVNVNTILNVDGQTKVGAADTGFLSADAFIGKTIDFLVKLVGTAALVLLVVGGFRLVVAAGNDNEIQKAKDMLKYAVIGLVVALLAYIIIATVQAFLYRN